MRVRILKHPKGYVDGVALPRYVPGETYDVSPAIAEYLVLSGYGRVEMRVRRVVKLSPKAERRTK